MFLFSTTNVLASNFSVSLKMQFLNELVSQFHRVEFNCDNNYRNRFFRLQEYLHKLWVKVIFDSMWISAKRTPTFSRIRFKLFIATLLILSQNVVGDKFETINSGKFNTILQLKFIFVFLKTVNNIIQFTKPV